MASLLENRAVQIMLVIFALYVFMQLSKQKGPEHMDVGTPLFENPTETVYLTPQQQQQQQLVIQPIHQGSNAVGDSPTTLTPAISGRSLPADVSQIVSQTASPESRPPSQPQGPSVPAPLTSVEEQLLAKAPAVTAPEVNMFDVAPVDYDEIFERRDELEPADLIPKVDTSELYGDIKSDPTYDQNFLTNSWSMGMETDLGKRDFINDLRGAVPIPLSIVSPWNNPTKLSPDFQRKSLGDIS